MHVLAVIPARGGSKGIPRKNVRLMNGKPLIAYAIQNANACAAISDVVVSSDDDEILTIAKKYNAYPLCRSAKLAQDAVTLDPVIYDAVVQMEALKNIRYDVVITLQPTSPLLTAGTLNEAICSFFTSEYDTFISATNQPHLAWSKNENGFFPLYKKRLNRQQLEPNYLEAGAFFISRRENVTENSRIGKKVSVYEIPAQEAVDIDTIGDWLVCENFLKRKKIVMRVDGTAQTGLERVNDCLTLAYNLFGHDIVFVTRADCAAGLLKIQASNFPLITIADDEALFAYLSENPADILVHHCGDTTAAYVKTLKQHCGRVVTMDDMGDGAVFADAVINPLGGNRINGKNVFAGEDYISLRDEFAIAKVKPFSETVQNVLVLFGGTDPSGLTRKVYDLANQVIDKYDGVSFYFVPGAGFDCAANGIVAKPDKRIFVEENVQYVSEYMEKADIAFTSQGRTVYELASLCVPSIVMAQNERETAQTFAQMKNGFFNLGLGARVQPQTLLKAFELLAESDLLRQEMRKAMEQHDFTGGVKRQIRLILGE